MDYPVKQRPKRVFRRAIISSFGVILVLATLTVGFMHPQDAKAWDGSLTQCTQIGLGYWDWINGSTRTDQPTGPGLDARWTAQYGAANHFNKDTTPYVLARGTGAPNITLWAPSSLTGTISFERYTDLGGAHYRMVSSTGTFTTFAITDGPKELYPSNNYTLTAAAAQNFSSPNNGLTCVYAARNVSYTNGWDVSQFNNSVAVGLNTGSCSVTDFGCWMGKIFDGVSNTLSGVMQAVIQSLVALWAPNGDTIKASFDDFNSFMTTKLGFIAYPITFLVQLVSSFNDTSQTWCTTTSCSKDVGALYGSHLVINFLQVKQAWPTLWAWLVTSLQGLTVLSVILAIRHRYLEILAK